MGKIAVGNGWYCDVCRRYHRYYANRKTPLPCKAIHDARSREIDERIKKEAEKRGNNMEEKTFVGFCESVGEKEDDGYIEQDVSDYVEEIVMKYYGKKVKIKVSVEFLGFRREKNGYGEEGYCIGSRWFKTREEAEAYKA